MWHGPPTERQMTSYILTINGGSSSVKFSLWETDVPPKRFLSGEIERIGLPGTSLVIKGGKDQPTERVAVDAPDHGRAAERLAGWLQQRQGLDSVKAIGHRIVHGGPKYAQSDLVTPELLAELQRLSPIDPTHLPGEIALIEAFARHLPGRPQVACFDTAFHHDLPTQARLLAVPRRYEAAGVRRYGFHGLSYTYLMEELTRLTGPKATRSRVILAHLGAGASLAAVRDGKCIDTSMAFTPTAGLVMGTRCGDMDPGFLIYLMRSEGLNAQQIDDLVNRQSGLAGVSEISSDMRDLLKLQPTDPRAADAVTLFCYQVKKWIGAYVVALGGIDTLVFAGGIGENASEIRARICEGLEILGLRLQNSRNSSGDAIISTDHSPATIRIIRTDEELVIAKDVLKLARVAIFGRAP